METKEFNFNGMALNGFAALFANIFLTIGGIAALVYSVCIENGYWAALGAIVLACALIGWAGFIMLEPNEARVMMFFGRYRGTFTRTGYYWVNPFITTKKLSLRARNLDAEPIKVNDKTGNPVMIGLVLVWKLKDTYKAMFEIDSQKMGSGNADNTIGTDL